jgi:hypothetical protein
MQNRERKVFELILFVVIASIYFYALTHRAFGYYFDRDDINNLSWGHIISPFEFLRDTVNVASMATIHTYRPVGALFYNLCYQAFGLSFSSFQVTRMGLHLLNASLAFLLIRSFVNEKFLAIIGALVFTFHVALLAAYWQISSIFDVLCASLMFLSFFFYTRTKKLFSIYFILSFLFFFLACRTKEMAFVLPVILFLYDFCSSKQNAVRFNVLESLKKLVPFLLLGLILGVPKVYSGFSVAKENPYALEISSLLEGLKFYSNHLFGIESTSYASVFLAAFFGLLALVLRSPTLQFSFLYTLISIMPVLLLINHRHGFYGYIPFFGVALYTAELLNIISNFITNKIGIRKRYIYATILLIFAAYTFANMNLKKPFEEDYLASGKKIEKFVGLLNLSQPKPDSKILFDSAPEDFDTIILTSAVHLLFHDWTINTDIIPDCEALVNSAEGSEAHCVSFNRMKVYKLRL